MEGDMTAFGAIQGQPNAVLDLDSDELSSELGEVDRRLHLVRGLADAFGRLDELNVAIQSAPNREAALEALQQAPFEYSRQQATAILDTPIGAQVVERVADFKEELDHLSGRRINLREQVTEVLAMHWFG
jgi:DNA gyrase/topoisomerase IV subunit A